MWFQENLDLDFVATSEGEMPFEECTLKEDLRLLIFQAASMGPTAMATKAAGLTGKFAPAIVGTIGNVI